jgi:ADP-ribosylglycohydrolase
MKDLDDFNKLEERAWEWEKMLEEKYGINEGNKLILGAVSGDIIGSVYEFHNVKRKDFELFTPETTFTDDSILTVATMEALLSGETTAGDYKHLYQSYGRKYPNRGWGNRFHYWIHSDDPEPYNSWGNGSAMRASPIGWVFDTAEEVLVEAEKSASVSHNHPEGIKGAQAASLAVFYACNGISKNDIKRNITEKFSYDLERTCDEIRAGYSFDESCQGTVPEAVTAFLESTGYEDAIRLAISLGGDSDTITCITGGIAEAFYGGVPDLIASMVLSLLPTEFTDVITEFSDKYGGMNK